MNMKKNGFTLVELIIAVALGLLILTAVYAGINMAQRSSASVGRKVVTQQDARAVLDLMAMEIRMASYNPTGAESNTIWSTIPTAACNSMGNISPVVANKGIQTGPNAANTIIIAMDLNGDGIIGPPWSNEYIEYSYNGADTINRNVSCGGDTPILGGAGSATMVRNAAAGVNLFTYFDRSNNDITATVVNPANNPSPANGVPAIRRIRITIVADTESKDSLTSNPRRMTYITDVLVRNHAFN
jgi:prepilin-type N-terminal cleavage/methylation domain-containing protein